MGSRKSHLTQPVNRLAATSIPDTGKPEGAFRCLSNAPSITCAVGCGHFLRFEVGAVQWFLFPVAILAGTLMVVQSGCNGMLEKILDRPVMVGIVSQTV